MVARKQKCRVDDFCLVRLAADTTLRKESDWIMRFCR
jgi:hypothetical protein